jgi:hypothetical protein
MEGHELLAKMTKVKAPEGFEASVLGRLPAARTERARARRLAFYRYAFAGAAGLLLVGFLVFAPSSREPDTVLTSAERLALTATPDFGRGGASSKSPVLPVYETLDYASEFRSVQPQARTVYILEQVSDSVRSEIIY